MKKVISLALLGATSSLMALDAEFAYLYKDPRIMGMGGANVAVGGYSTSVFSNPAGLAQIKKENGYVVDLLGIGISASKEYNDLINDMKDVETDSNINPNATNDMIDVLTKYSGDHFHLGVDDYSAISKNSDDFAWSIGLLIAADTNVKVHANGGASFVETSSRGYGGVNFGVAKPYDTDFGVLDIGFNLKYISQVSYEGGLTINDLMSENDDIAQKMQDKYEKKASGFGADLGAILHPFSGSAWHPAIGASVLNIGAMGMDNNYGQQPMTVNFGASVAPEVSFIDKLVIAVDYVDALNANKVRFYNISTETVETQDYTDGDMMKRLRMGVGLGLFDTTAISLALNGGYYQSAYTAGIDLELLIFKLNVATYQEEIGTGSASNTDRRYMAKLTVGW
jgi:hypothetical protein